MNEILNENDHNEMMKDIKNQFYINQLKAKISYYNNQSEYFRLKYYHNMIHLIKVLKEVSK